MHYNMPPGYWVKDWHEEYGGLYGIILSRDAIQIIEEKGMVRMKLVRLDYILN